MQTDIPKHRKTKACEKDKPTYKSIMYDNDQRHQHALLKQVT